MAKIDAQKLRFERLKAARRLMPNERVAKCLWQMVAQYFEVWKSRTGKPAHFRKIFTCGSRAMCPVCAAKITERCKNDLVAAFDVCHVHKVNEFMGTFTLEHHAAEKFEKVLNDLVESVSDFRGRKFWTNIEKKYEIFGSVTSLENTYGVKNGNHPHKHIIFFSRRKLTEADYKDLQIEITKVYGKILLEKYNRSLSKTNGVNFRGAPKEVLEYVSKYGHEPRKIWNHATEITKAEQKTGYKIGERFTPFQLLDENNLGDVDAGKAFQVYARAMKGKAFLTWSDGLRDLFGLGVELSDEEIAAMNDERDSLPFALGDGVAWKKVRENQHDFLNAARNMDFQAFKDHIQSLGVDIETDEISISEIFARLAEQKTITPKNKKRIRKIPHDAFESMMSLDFATFRAAVKILPKFRVENDSNTLPDLEFAEILEAANKELARKAKQESISKAKLKVKIQEPGYKAKLKAKRQTPEYKAKLKAARLLKKQKVKL
jgi:hypothetical protein